MVSTQFLKYHRNTCNTRKHQGTDKDKENALMETQTPQILHKLTGVIARTGLSRSAIYREIYSESNTKGRLKVVRIGRAVRVREQDLNDFINALAS